MGYKLIKSTEFNIDGEYSDGMIEHYMASIEVMDI